MQFQELIDRARERFPAIIADLEIRDLLNSDEDVLLYFELYKLLTRDEIVEYCNQQGLFYLSCEQNLKPEEIADRQYRLDNNNLLVYKCSNTTRELIVVTTQFMSISESVDIFFSDYEFTVMNITPLNYRLLIQGVNCVYDLYDPLIFFKRLIYDAIAYNASDIHIVNNQTGEINPFTESLEGGNGTYEYRVFYRILNDYVSRDLFKLNKEFNDTMIERIVRDGTMGMSVDLSSTEGVKTSWLNPLGDGSCDIRITCSSTRGGLTLVGRIQTMKTVNKTIETLGFDGRVQEALQWFSRKENGLTLITGPVRSGKNTTMNAIVNSMKERPIKFIEYSSPMEISQRFEQLDYNDDRRSLLNYINLAKKQDINMAIINELPRKEVADAVVDLINSSIGVMTTFHIDRIWDLPYKLKNYFGEDFIDLITHINGVVNQKMFVKICPNCAVETYNTDLPKFVLECMEKYEINSYKEGKGCAMCNYTGRANVVQPYAEFLLFDKNIKSSLLRCDKPYQMEDIIRDTVLEKHQSLEYVVADAIRQGMLHPLDFEKLE